MKTLGPTDARVAILLDFPSKQDFSAQLPLSDYAGGLFFDLLSRRGFLKSSCFVLSVLDKPLPTDPKALKKAYSELYTTRKTCPGAGWEKDGDLWVSPELLRQRAKAKELLSRVSPALVITLGDLSLWALTGRLGAAKWRGSRLSAQPEPYQILATISPRVLPTDPTMSSIFQMDLARAKDIYEGTQLPRSYNFQIQPAFAEAKSQLEALLALANSSTEEVEISLDIETRSGHITCIGLAWDEESAICLPLITVNDSSPFYWTEEEESQLIFLMAQILRHPRVLTIGQNISYDCQYLYRHWGFLPRAVFDTMIGHHSIFSNMRKGLDFLSSMYAQDHVFWKDDIRDWDPKLGERQYWEYNCKDAALTAEIAQEIRTSAGEKGLTPHLEFQQSLFFPVIRMMNRGIRLDTTARAGLRNDLISAQFERQEMLDYVAGHPLNPKSPAQLSKFFYDDLGIPGVKNLTGDSLTTNSPAMALIAEREPALKPLCQLIVELRSIGVFLSTFIDARLDSDDRMRCSFSIAGTTTYRFSSSENAFGSGMNLQNIPVAEKAKIKSASYIKLPNIRKLFTPDQGYTFWDMDLDRADLQVVVWEASDSDMKLALRENLDMHCVNACTIFDLKGIPYDELREDHPNYREHRARIGEAHRGKAKAGVHATNYGVGDRKLAQALGITVLEAGRFRSRWFGAHPGVSKWHARVEESARKRGYVENRFGARIYTLGRINLPELLGWIPQSTVAGVINRALVNIDREEQAKRTSIQLLLQVHDSLGGQFLTAEKAKELLTLRECARIPIPYEEELIIPVGIKTSEKSWGDCK